jgi:hypothetical protein
VLIDAPVFEFLPVAPGPQATYTVPIPATAALAGARLFTQAVHFGGPPTLLFSNALDLTFGS